MASGGDTYQQSGKFGIGHMSGGEISGNAKIAAEIHEEQSINLAEIASEIEKLLDYFKGHQNPNITDEAREIVKTAVERQPGLQNIRIVEAAVVTSPTVKQRLMAAGQAAYVETVKILLPPLGVVIEAGKAWQNPE